MRGGSWEGEEVRDKGRVEAGYLLPENTDGITYRAAWRLQGMFYLLSKSSLEIHMHANSWSMYRLVIHREMNIY